MTETIWYGQDNIIRFTSIHDSSNSETAYTDFTGENTGDALPGVILVFSENRQAGWVDQPITDPVCLWNAENVAVWEAEIPEEYITLQNGNGTLQISGTGMKMVTIPLTIGGGSVGGGSEIIITGYTHNATAQTLTITDSAYTTMGVERVKEIRNLSTHCLLYDYRNPSANASTGHEIGIQIDGAVIHYDYSTTSATNDDKIMIVVFAASA